MLLCSYHNFVNYGRVHWFGFACFYLFCNSNSVAIIFSFESFERAVCPGKDICSTDCQPDAFISMKRFLFIAGAAGIALTIVHMMALTVFSKVFVDTIELAAKKAVKTDGVIASVNGVKTISNLSKCCAALPSVTLRSGWGIAGCVLYFAQVDDSCSSTNEALIVLLWCILTLAISILDLFWLVRLWNSSRIMEEFEQLFPHDDAEDATL